jgi:pimeloyl-ACP methyl ester carboxylesterase
VAPVIVAHGLWMPGPETFLLQRRLHAAGFEPLLFRFPTVSAGLDANVARLEAFLSQRPEAKLHLVGYSLGGVLSVCAGRGALAMRIGRIVCLGSPLNGSRAAVRLAGMALTRRLLGKSMHDLIARAPLPPWSGTPELGLIAGSMSVGAGRLLAAFDGPNDGTVQVDETRLPGANAHIVLPVSHTTLLFSRDVAAQTAAFLTTGRFAGRRG